MILKYDLLDYNIACFAVTDIYPGTFIYNMKNIWTHKNYSMQEHHVSEHEAYYQGHNTPSHIKTQPFQVLQLIKHVKQDVITFSNKFEKISGGALATLPNSK